MLIEIVFFSALLGFLALIRFFPRPHNFPPGPRGLPLVGYVPFLNEHDPVYPFKGMMKLAEIYGPIVGFFVGPKQPFISICGYEAVREALLNQDLNGRPEGIAFLEKSLGKNLGIIFADGDVWKEQRRFTFRHLKELGFGRISQEDLIHEEVRETLDNLKHRSQSNPRGVVSINASFNISVINLILAVVAGKRFRHDDTKFQRVLETMDEIFRAGQVVRGLIQVPQFVLYMCPFLEEYLGKKDYLVERLLQFASGLIDEHEEKLPKNFDPKDFIDVYLQEIQNQAGRKNSSFSKKQLIVTIMDLCNAGAETTSNTIGFSLLYLLHYPDIQKRMQEELDSVFGSSMPTLAHREQTKYCDAVLMEIQRMANVVPFPVPHLALKDTQVQGYTIPKGSIVQMNLYSVHFDKTIFEDPYAFRPERHLDTKGKLIKSAHLMPFGAGKRKCPGETLAKNVMFLFLTSLIKTFTFSPVEGQPLPTLAPKNGFTLTYKSFDVVIKSRN